MLEFQSIKIFLLKNIPPIGQKRILLLVKLKKLPWMYVINNLNGKEIFIKKNCKKLIKKILE